MPAWEDLEHTQRGAAIIRRVRIRDLGWLAALLGCVPAVLLGAGRVLPFGLTATLVLLVPLGLGLASGRRWAGASILLLAAAVAVAAAVADDGGAVAGAGDVSVSEGWFLAALFYGVPAALAAQLGVALRSRPWRRLPHGAGTGALALVPGVGLVLALRRLLRDPGR